MEFELGGYKARLTRVQGYRSRLTLKSNFVHDAFDLFGERLFNILSLPLVSYLYVHIYYMYCAKS